MLTIQVRNYPARSFCFYNIVKVANLNLLTSWFAHLLRTSCSPLANLNTLQLYLLLTCCSPLLLLTSWSNLQEAGDKQGQTFLVTLKHSFALGSPHNLEGASDKRRDTSTRHNRGTAGSPHGGILAFSTGLYLLGTAILGCGSRTFGRLVVAVKNYDLWKQFRPIS